MNLSLVFPPTPALTRNSVNTQRGPLHVSDLPLFVQLSSLWHPVPASPAAWPQLTLPLFSVQNQPGSAGLALPVWLKSPLRQPAGATTGSPHLFPLLLKACHSLLPDDLCLKNHCSLGFFFFSLVVRVGG